MTSGKARREKEETDGGEGGGAKRKTSQIFVAHSFVWSKGLGRKQNTLADSVIRYFYLFCLGILRARKTKTFGKKLVIICLRSIAELHNGYHPAVLTDSLYRLLNP